MNDILLQKHWVSQLRRYNWFRTDCVPYPDDDLTPEFLKEAYFVPEFRLQEIKEYPTVLLGAYESFAHARKHLQEDFASAMQL